MNVAGGAFYTINKNILKNKIASETEIQAIKDKIKVSIRVYFVLAKILRIKRNEATWANIGILGANFIGRNAINPI